MAKPIPPFDAKDLAGAGFVIEMGKIFDKLMQENQVLENRISVLERKLREARYSGGARQDEMGRVQATGG